MADRRRSTLRELRTRTGLTQEALADRSGVSVSTIRGMENGTRVNPRPDTLRQLADVLGLAPIEYEDLLAENDLPSAERSTRPRQLPAAPHGFTGRADFTVEVPTVLTGPGGIGKTWLALHWAHEHAGEFPDGHLFVDLRGYGPDDDPAEPQAALRGFLDALGVNDFRGGLAEHAALYRSHVAGRRMLIVLDNAASADQVVPLLPGSSTCTVLITSRTTLSALLHRHGVRHVRLDVLGDNEAYGLLARRIGDWRLAAEPDVVRELIGLCGGYPLALAIVAGRAHAHPDIPLSEFAAELTELGLDALDDADPAASLPAVLSWSLRTLTPQQREVFGLLGVAPGVDISAAAAAALTGLSRPRVVKVLRELEDASLLRRQANGRYVMYDLIRRFAATPGSDINRGLLDFYVSSALAADRVLDPHRASPELDAPEPMDEPAALAWFAAEHANLFAVQRWAAERGHSCEVRQLAWAMTTFHLRQSDRDAELASWRLAAVSHDVQAHRYLGRAHADLGQHQEALAHLGQALALKDEAAVLDSRGYIAQHTGHPDCALQCYRQAVALWRNDFEAARTLEQLGHVHRTLDQHDQAREVWSTVLNVYQGAAADRVRQHLAALDCRRIASREVGNHLAGEQFQVIVDVP
ncbi:helix-turn-helix domain-containing protein [Kutzneria sp. 744]|uniref:ATP-binding protein n=1 Tax=Kutzneria sp. (strain 744) TaxID=345341 RepID=UPI0003EEB62F|nr:helix-turn-helix domain-containing protein [Kutzneria sp. 744]EWM18475.1 transcriptional regulator [Kutzneria sp. 744]